MLFDLGEIEMNRQFGPVDGLYSTSHKNPAFYGDISAVSLVFNGENTNQQQGFCSRNRSGQSNKKRGRRPKYFGGISTLRKGQPLAHGGFGSTTNHTKASMPLLWFVPVMVQRRLAVGAGS